MKMNKVIGWRGRNIGDDSYKLSFPMFFNAEFDFSEQQNSPDTVILGGGDIFNEYYVNKVLAISAKKHLAISVSTNSLTPLNLLSNFDQIVVRDLKSLNYLQSNNVKCRYMPDISTLLKGNKEIGYQKIKQMFNQEGHELYKKVVGVVFNAHLFSGKSDMLARDLINFNYVNSQLAKLMDETPASFIFFPMSTGMPNDDRVTNAFLANRCKFWQKNYVIYDRLDVQDTLDIIAGCDVVISSRLHASIFSLTSNIPFIDITHHDKNKNYLETLGLQDLSISYWNFDYDKIKCLLKSMIDNSIEYKERLGVIHNRQLDILKKESHNVHLT